MERDELGPKLRFWATGSRMDLVNSVTQNSNNRNITMENQGGDGEAGDQGGGSPSSKLRGSSGGGEARQAECNQGGNSSQQMSPESTSEGAGASQSAASEQPAPPKSTPALEPKSQVPDYLRALGMDPRKYWPKKYRFTREKPPGQHNPLSIAQRNFYENNGYIVFDDCASKKLLDAIQSEHKQSELVNEFLLDKLLMKNNRLLQYVKCFCDERLMLMTHRLIDDFRSERLDLEALIDNKQLPTGQLLFRDWMYLPFRPIDKVCCAITAIEPLEHVLLVVPGTHRVGQCTISSTLDNVSAAYDSSQEKGGQAREIFECSPQRLSSLVEKSKRGFKYVNLKPGQTLFYHPGLIHGFSQDLIHFRKSQLASIAYYAAADCEYVDLRKSAPSLWGQQQAEGNNNNGEQQQQFLVPVSLAHFGPDKNPIDYTSWLDKPRLVGANKL